ncbi:MAG: AAA family ATPase [Desulfobacula sp.]|jgi:pilus assembly protein CpaE|nr:AAA family ATPase [Desulfobacula sp.]
MKKAQIKLAIKSPELKGIFTKLVKTADTFKLVSDTSLIPDLLIYEISQDYGKDLIYIRALLQKKVSREIFIVSEKSEPEMLIQILRLGIKEFFPVPLEKDSILDAFDRFIDRYQKLQKTKSEHQGQILSVLGSKGGVGTTTIAVNLAASLAEKQKKPSVALLDMNIIFGEVPMFLDITPKHHWGDITKNIERLDDFFLEDILTKHESGINILTSPRSFGEYLAPTPAIIEALLNLMKNKYEYIIIDLGQSMNDSALKILNLSEIVHIVTIQSLPCLSNTNRMIKSIVEYGYVEKENINVVLNRFIKKGMVTLDSAEEGIGQKMAWVIPNDYSTTMSAINSGKPLSGIADKSKIVKSFQEYVTQFLPGKGQKKNSSWFF